MSLGPPLTGRERVLVRLPSWLGDFVAAEPALRALHEHVEHLEHVARGALTLVGLAPHLALLAGRFPRARRCALAARAADDARAWREHDVALLFTGSFRSAWCAWRARIPRRVGFARDGRALLLTDAVRPARERGGVPFELGRAGGGRRYLPRPLGRSLSELLGLLGVPCAHVRPVLDVPAEARAAAHARRATLGLDPDAPFVLASVGARAGSAKGVPAELWARALSILAAEARLPLLLACGPGEEAALEAVREHMAERRDGARTYALCAPVAGLTELLAHCAAARLFVGADSGPRHLARALERAAVIVAGPTDPRHCSVDERERLVRVRVPCGPCHRERCPLSGAHALRCMHEIEPARIAAAACELLAATAEQRGL